MPTIAELERELDEQRERTRSKARRRREWHEAVARKDARFDRLIATAEDARDDRDRNREQLVLIRDRIEVVEADGIAAEEEQRHQHLLVRLEEEVDANEDLTALIQRVLLRADQVERDRDKAREHFQRFTQDYRAARRRRDRIARQLKAAREAAQNPLGTDLFVVAEFDCRDGTPVPEASVPALKALVQGYLLPLRKAGGPVHVNSGFRTLAYNRSIGGASMSIHVYNASWQHSPWAVAADHWQEGRSPGAVQAWHDANTRPDGMGYYSSFTHVDNRNRIGWSDSRWNGP
jgi:hypothetical protein